LLQNYKQFLEYATTFYHFLPLFFKKNFSGLIINHLQMGKKIRSGARASCRSLTGTLKKEGLKKDVQIVTSAEPKRKRFRLRRWKMRRANLPALDAAFPRTCPTTLSAGVATGRLPCLTLHLSLVYLIIQKTCR
jgi:hypothetical protein